MAPRSQRSRTELGRALPAGVERGPYSRVVATFVEAEPLETKWAVRRLARHHGIGAFDEYTQHPRPSGWCALSSCKFGVVRGCLGGTYALCCQLFGSNLDVCD